MNSKELREKFLEFFEERGHKIIPSSSLVPENDPSVLFTTAGMQQFKFYYTGVKNPLKEPLNNVNVSTCQKCFRTSDIESVGDNSHLTFFEMLGNFSFGGYFKKEAIEYAYELLNSKFQIPNSRMAVTVFEGDKNIPRDEESAKVWHQFGFSEKNGNLKFLGKDNNFWGPTGNEGPCGPTTEIYVDETEIWNLVFNEYYQYSDETLKPLKIKGVDTGMGLERLTLVMQYPQDKQRTIYDTDLFKDLIIYLKSQGTKGEERIYRIIADHFRAAVFLAAAGIIPSNTDKGYILRRLIRRIVRFEKIIKLDKNWYPDAFEFIEKNYGQFYPELKNQKEILSVLSTEREKFEKTLEKGLKEFEKLFSNYKGNFKEFPLNADYLFNLYQTYGFPVELSIEEINRKRVQCGGILIPKDTEEFFLKLFRGKLKKHQEISRAGKEKKFGGHGIQDIENKEDKEKVIKLHTATHLLLQALRIILDDRIEQKGSDITPEKLRLDFPFPRKLTAEELKKVENLVNQKIKENLIVHHYETSYEEAIRKGALGSFKDRYPEKVTIYEIKDSKTKNPFSREICAGPHVQTTKEIGSFKILKEEAVGQGIRRIKATIE